MKKQYGRYQARKRLGGGGGMVKQAHYFCDLLKRQH